MKSKRITSLATVTLRNQAYASEIQPQNETMNLQQEIEKTYE